MGNGGDDVLLLGVGVAPAVGDFFVYVEEGQKGGGDGDIVRQSAVFPVFPSGSVGGQVVGSDVFIFAACFNVQYLSEIFHGKRRIGDDGHMDAFAVVKMLKVFFGIQLVGFSVGACDKPVAFPAVCQYVEGVDLPLAEQIGFDNILSVGAVLFDFEGVYGAWLQLVCFYGAFVRFAVNADRAEMIDIDLGFGLIGRRDFQGQNVSVRVVVFVTVDGGCVDIAGIGAVLAVKIGFDDFSPYFTDIADARHIDGGIFGQQNFLKKGVVEVKGVFVAHGFQLADKSVGFHIKEHFIVGVKVSERGQDGKDAASGGKFQVGGDGVPGDVFVPVFLPVVVIVGHGFVFADVVDSVAGDMGQVFQGFDDGVADNVISYNFSGRRVFFIGRVAHEEGAELAVFRAVQLFHKIGAVDGEAVGNSIVSAGSVFIKICAEGVIPVLSGPPAEQSDKESYVFVEPEQAVFGQLYLFPDCRLDDESGSTPDIGFAVY